MAVFDVPFGEWLPSQPTFKNPGCEVADNVIPVPGGYDPFLSAVTGTGEASDVVKGAQQFFNNSGSSVIVGGTDDSLFIRTSSLTETAGMSSIGAGEAWDFARFNDFVIATAANNSPQYLSDIDSDTSWSGLPGSPPTAKRCAKVGDFLMLGNISGTPNRIQWSRYNNPTGTWGTDRRSQSSFADLDSQFGAVQRIAGGRYATVFQERGIQRLSYVGPPVVFRADVIEEDRGCIAPFSVAQVGYLSYFLAQDGFFVTNGSSVQPIGTSKVNRWFFDNANQTQLHMVQSAIDWQNEIVIWGFVSAESDSTFDKCLIYSWAQNRFSTATVGFEWLVGSQEDGIDLDSLDAIYSDLDSIPFSLDAAQFKAGARVLSAFIGGVYSTFNGTPLEATWETGESQPSPKQRVFVSEAMPMIDTDTWDCEVELLMRDNRGAQTVSGRKVTGWSGFAPVRGEGQKMAIRVIKPAGTAWSAAQGVQVRYQPAGYR